MGIDHFMDGVHCFFDDVSLEISYNYLVWSKYYWTVCYSNRLLLHKNTPYFTAKPNRPTRRKTEENSFTEKVKIQKDIIQSYVAPVSIGGVLSPTRCC